MHTILHIGAGQATELSDWLKTGAERIVLVEPNPILAEQLRERAAGDQRVIIVEAAVTTDPVNNKLLYEYNLPEASSLHEATRLRVLFPGLRTIATHTVRTLSPEQLLERYGARSGEPSLLALDTPGEQHSILQQLIKIDKLKQFKSIYLVANPEPFYQCSTAANQTLELLFDYGYSVTEFNDGDPDWQSWYLVRDPIKDQLIALQEESAGQRKELMSRIHQLEKKLEQQKLKHSEMVEFKNARIDDFAVLNNKLKETVEKNNNIISMLKNSVDEKEQSKRQAEKLLSENKERCHALEKKIKNLENELVTEKEKNFRLLKDLEFEKSQCEEKASINGSISRLEKSILNLSRNFNNGIDEKLLNVAKQIESTMGVQNYFNTGELPFSYHGWPISPDLAMFLTERIETKDFDLVIEFGSGTSTALFAKIFRRIFQRSDCGRKKDYIEDDDKNGVKEMVRCSDSVTPSRRIITFEHSKVYYEKTRSLLLHSKGSDYVELVNAPLIKYSYENEEYLYYDCEATLKELAELYRSRKISILVLVDGPPGSTGPCARFPALPVLLNNFPSARYQIVLDDLNRGDEKEVVEKWLGLLRKRSLSHNFEEIPLEKGLAVIEIN